MAGGNAPPRRAPPTGPRPLRVATPTSETTPSSWPRPLGKRGPRAAPRRAALCSPAFGRDAWIAPSGCRLSALMEMQVPPFFVGGLHQDKGPFQLKGFCSLLALKHRALHLAAIAALHPLRFPIKGSLNPIALLLTSGNCTLTIRGCCIPSPQCYRHPSISCKSVAAPISKLYPNGVTGGHTAILL